jgi:3-oxoacyl-[acyl-carrier-protein] synthase II
MVYINGTGNISPQLTFGDVPFLKALTDYTDGRVPCIEPDYSGWIDARAIRRMSRVIRMGVASAAFALKKAEIEKPDAIITGTSLGCLEDTGIFLTKIIENKEEALNPTPFIQSTHNTIGSQIALLIQCFGYNQTYSHRAFSFENSLLDGMMMVNEKGGNILVGGVDELTNTSYDILKRFDLFKTTNGSSLKLFESNTDRTIPGEGASYFVLSNIKANSVYATVNDLATLYKPESPEAINAWVTDFISKSSLSPKDIEFVLLGKNGDQKIDATYDQFITNNFPHATTGVYKHLCGEYETANGFGMWVAAKMLKRLKVPYALFHKGNADLKPKRVLIYNQYLGSHHSLILLEAC